MGQPEAAYQFDPDKLRSPVKLHLLSGITLVPWLRLLWVYGKEIHWHLYWHRIMFLTLMACLNTLLAIPDWLRFTRAVASTPLHAEPLIILGHPRTGTTHLHNLLSLDPAFCHATTFQAGFPSSFITLEEVGARPLLQPLLSETRPMDAMKLTWDLPAEDEIAVTTLSGGVSYYLPVILPCSEPSVRHLLSLRGVGPGQGLTQWQDAFTWFLQKVTFRNCRARALTQQQRAGARSLWQRTLQTLGLARIQQRGSSTSSSSSGTSSDLPPGSQQSPWDTLPLLIKSPVHTARLNYLRSVFPKARYLFIHRHPLTVFASSCHMADSYFSYCYLQRPSNEMMTAHILRQGAEIHREYMAERGRVDPERLVELSFEQLDSDPIGVLRRVYTHFGWESRFELLLPRFQVYCASLQDFKKNSFRQLPPELEARVRREWSHVFTDFGYK